MSARDFWSLSRDERSERIAKAEDTGTCSICQKPIRDGEARDGQIHAHWDCAHDGTIVERKDIPELIASVERKADLISRKLAQLDHKSRR